MTSQLRRPSTVARIGRACVVASIAILAVTACSSGDDDSGAKDSTSQRSSAASSDAQTAGSECEYTESSRQAAKSVDAPPADVADLKDTTLTITTNQGDIGLSLDAEKAPCTVNSFLSLAEQGYFDNTSCHRLTTSSGLQVLQCGDPSGTGAGGPGYSFADEYPVGESSSATLYKRGVLAMANAGPDTNGSQFFLVYGDSQLTPDYTIFGTIDTAGLDTIDKIVAGGVEAGDRGPDDGAPKNTVEIESVAIG